MCDQTCSNQWMLKEYYDQIMRVRKALITEAQRNYDEMVVSVDAILIALDGEIGSVEPVKLEALDGEQ